MDIENKNLEKKIRKAKKKQKKEEIKLKKSKHRAELEIPDLDSYRGYYRMYFGNPYRT
ncbi:MAG: hypothetical protein ACFE9Q_00865 [Candidatus Hodarchaeota archaeon]